ncbi:helix-turn-helix domain-containing protein [Moraxella sp. K127]|uniref:S24 family peptidase n=1 Tax=Moraxella sp. K127 TaxID=2780079 RepID=UPI00187DE7FB|nr:S24 family peptidase [Moraxella sp. K127]MBE9590009.1 helix-turn-helix domain-containing protein [Moraxella sp. K127]
MSDFLERLVKIAGTTNQSEIARQLDIPKTTLSNWITRGVSKGGALKISQVYGVNVEYVLTGQGEMTARPTTHELCQRIKAIENRKSEVEPSDFLSVENPVPIISWVAAGSWSSSDAVEWLDEDTEYLPRPANLSADGFCLRVRGVSMMPEFKPDEVIFVEPNFGVWDLKNGDLVVVCENDNHEATFKQLIMGETSADMYLKPLNPDWHEQRMTPKSEWELVGKVVGKWVKY